jgi:hypothetical protein
MKLKNRKNKKNLRRDETQKSKNKKNLSRDETQKSKK